ncbi:MAG TPA: grasp-with-spasm system SPASM domain peptide maturase [Thermoanaerobaculia bacterium]
MRRKSAFKLYACCVPVRGAVRSTLCDLQRQTYRFIPNALYDILTQHEGKTLSEIKRIYGSKARPVIDDYFKFLIENEFGFWCDEPDAFPALDLSWERPERVVNAIIDIDVDSSHNYYSLLHQLDKLGCPALQYRFFCSITWDQLEVALKPTEASRLRSIDLIVRYNPDWEEEALERLCLRHQRISDIFVHSSPVERTVHVRAIGTRILYLVQAIDSSSHCGFVHPRYFAVTLEGFVEAHHHNSCLNRKVSVDAAGNIRNCPAMARSYGHASEVPLADALARPEFREAWDVTKDQVEICQECEFRYICTDCRALISDSANPLSKPLRCGYDPFTATWKSI